MESAKINGLATYHKAIKDLSHFGYIRYIPSYNPAKENRAYLLPQLCCENKKECIALLFRLLWLTTLSLRLTSFWKNWQLMPSLLMESVLAAPFCGLASRKRTIIFNVVRSAFCVLPEFSFRPLFGNTDKANIIQTIVFLLIRHRDNFMIRIYQRVTSFFATQ